MNKTEELISAYISVRMRSGKRGNWRKMLSDRDVVEGQCWDADNGIVRRIANVWLHGTCVASVASVSSQEGNSHTTTVELSPRGWYSLTTCGRMNAALGGAHCPCYVRRRAGEYLLLAANTGARICGFSGYDEVEVRINASREVVSVVRKAGKEQVAIVCGFDGYEEVTVCRNAAHEVVAVECKAV